MKVLINNNEQEITANKITIVINEDVEFDIRVNQFNELVINKGQFGTGENSILIKPYQVNEILLT